MVPLFTTFLTMGQCDFKNNNFRQYENIKYTHFFIETTKIMLKCNQIKGVFLQGYYNGTVKLGKMERWGNLEFTIYYLKKKKEGICNFVGKFVIYIFFILPSHVQFMK